MNQTLDKDTRKKMRRDSIFVAKLGTYLNSVHKSFLPLNDLYVCDIHLLRQFLIQLCSYICNSENV